MLKVAIVENEKEQTEITKSFLERYGKEKGVKMEIQSFPNGFDFLENAKAGFDVVFMDIDMPGMNGMEASEKFRKSQKKASLIFVTNLPQYAIDGYKVDALDFILKPMTYEDFSLAMGKVMARHQEDKGSFAIESHGVVRKLLTEEVLFIEVVKHDIVIHLTSKENITFRGSIKALENKLNPDYFFKCNSGYVINLDYVKALDSDMVVLTSGDRLAVSRSHRKELLNRINELFSKEMITRS